MVRQFQAREGLRIVMEGQSSRMILSKSINDVTITVALNHSSSIAKGILDKVNSATFNLDAKTSMNQNT